MVYFNNGSIAVRSMQQQDAETIHNENLQQGWHSNIDVYKMYFDEQERGKRYVFVAEQEGEFAGYTTLKLQATAGPFANAGIPEISDFNVFQKYRRRGIGSTILDVAERKAAELCNSVCLGVGLHSGYGSAQRLYVKRGYVPDGSGVWYQDSLLGQYADCCNDDDLVLYLSKQVQFE